MLVSPGPFVRARVNFAQNCVPFWSLLKQILVLFWSFLKQIWVLFGPFKTNLGPILILKQWMKSL